MTQNQPQVIVVLGGGIDEKGILSRQSLQRVQAAASLHRQHPDLPIVLSGRWGLSVVNPLPQTEAAAMRQELVTLGVPDALIHLEEVSMDTPSNAFCAATRWLIPNGWHHLLLVTSDYHMARALLTFERVLGSGFSIIPYPASSQLSPEERQERQRWEAVFTAHTNDLFAGIVPGDLEAMRPRLRARHADLRSL